LLALVEGEIDILQTEKRIRGRVKQQMEKTQREYYLNEQMKAIQKELGDLDEDSPKRDRGSGSSASTRRACRRRPRDKAQSELRTS
jgi:ATP-dependent Lon protease